MSGARRRRLAALVASVLLASLTLLIGGSATATQAAPQGPCVEPTITTGECPTTTTPPSSSETTTSLVETTTTFKQTTTTRRQTATTAERVVTTTSTSLDVATSLNVLVPGDGTEGAESTTTTTQTPTTISNDGTSDGALLALIVGGLLVLAVAVSILTWRYWAATRPPLVATVGSDHG